MKCDHSEMKATEQYFPVVLFIMLYKVVLTFESVDETLKCTTTIFRICQSMSSIESVCSCES